MPKPRSMAIKLRVRERTWNKKAKSFSRNLSLVDEIGLLHVLEFYLGPLCHRTQRDLIFASPLFAAREISGSNLVCSLGYDSEYVQARFSVPISLVLI
jgi:hypothetical protein